jgi:hypothetical protein
MAVPITSMRKIPSLDLAAVDPSEYKEAITGFTLKHSLDFKSVLIIGLDGHARYVATNTAPSEWLLGNLTKVVRLAPQGSEIIVTDPSNVAQTFMELTKYTVPHGHELQYYDTTLKAHGFTRNERGNYWATVGDSTSKTLFVAHLDTADHGKPIEIVHRLPGDGYVGTDGNSILGADDRAGVAVLLYMMSQNVPGDYLMVIGEERGCIGSSDEAKHIEKGRYNRAIQFDRAGTSEVITHQMGVRTASREFARALCKKLRKYSDGVINLQPSDNGVYTDTKEFIGIIRECTNVSIGYEAQHRNEEIQDLAFLVTMAHACIKVEWEQLPTRNDYTVGFGYSGKYKWLDESYQDHEDDVFNDPASDLERGIKNMWEMWAEVDCGNWDAEDLRKWVIYNPAKAAQIIRHHILMEPVTSLDTLTRVETGV